MVTSKFEESMSAPGRHEKKGAGRRGGAVKRGLAGGALVVCALGLAACARFHPKPLSAAQNAEQLEERSLTNAGVKAFLESNLHRELAGWPEQPWDFDMLEFAAFYYQPNLAVARAQWAVAQGGEVTAAQRPNPTLNVTPGYNTTTSIPSPWIPLTTIDVPIETAGKRKHRRAQAGHLAEAARLKVASAAWQVRSTLRAALLDALNAGKRVELLKQQVALQAQVVKLMEQQVQAGALAGSETVTFHIALTKAQLDLLEAQRLQVEARSRLAEAIGVPLRALEQVKIAPDCLQPSQNPAELTAGEVRRLALQSRPDILAGLADYAASESALQLEIARQYPDLRIMPGYQYDQGDNKWSIGLTVDLPVLNRNEGPIAEAKARREEAAAKFTALQAGVLAEIERATEQLSSTQTNATALQALAREQERRREAVAAQLRAGALEPLDLANAQVEWSAAQVVQLEGEIKVQQAMGALEDAVRRPLFGSPAAAPTAASAYLGAQPKTNP